ncbi:MAG: hypothetical protein AAFN78_12355 [Pseudomonadota bacterium]
MKKTILIALGSVVALAWLSLGVGLAIEVTRESWLVWVTSVAVITEVAIWCAAATMGLAVFEARKKAWRWLTRPFRIAG